MSGQSGVWVFVCGVSPYIENVLHAVRNSLLAPSVIFKLNVAVVATASCHLSYLNFWTKFENLTVDQV